MYLGAGENLEVFFEDYTIYDGVYGSDPIRKRIL